MKKFCLSVLIFAFVCFVSCANDDSPVISNENPVVSKNQTETPIEIAKQRIDVSPHAEKYFLKPLDKYSWEKEFDTEYIMLHFTSNVVGDRENPYDMQAIRKIFEDYEISIHYIIDRDGKAFCYIPESRSAWHAGVGEYAEDEKYTNKINKYSVGIEMVAIGSKNDMAQYLEGHEYDALDKELVGFTDAQYDTLKKLVPDICERNNIPFDREHVIGHQEYNPNKNDPGELFDWDRLFE